MLKEIIKSYYFNVLYFSEQITRVVMPFILIRPCVCLIYLLCTFINVYKYCKEKHFFLLL